MVFSDGERAMGLVVDEIVDIVEERLDIEIAADRSDLIGSAVLRGRATEIINIAHFLPLAYDDWARGPKKPEAQLDAPAGRRLGLLPRHAEPGAEGRGLPA